MRFAFILGVGLSLLVVARAEPPSSQPATIPFDIHVGYFVSNQFEPNAPVSFVGVQDQKAFDGVFGTALVMGKVSNYLPADAFESKIVVAAIKRGKAVWEFKVQEVTAADGLLAVRYTTTSTNQDSAEFACPLIVSVPKGGYTAVEFVEDGKSVKKIEIAGKPATAPATQAGPVTEAQAKELAATFAEKAGQKLGQPTGVTKQGEEYWVGFETPQREVALLGHRTVIVNATTGKCRFMGRD